MNELTALPDSFAAGTTTVYRRSFADYPASDGWTLKLHLRGKSALDVTATPDGDDFILTLTATATGVLVAGGYTWSEQVTRGSGAGLEAHDPATGCVWITPNLVTAAAGDLQAELENRLVAVQAEIRIRMTADVERYQVGSRLFEKTPILELLRIEKECVRGLARLRHPGPFAGKILASFPGAVL